MKFEEMAVIITGGSKGIGLSIAKVFARQTNRSLVLIARSERELSKARDICLQEGAPSVNILPADLTDPEAFGQVDFKAYDPGILVNNAGSFLFKPLESTSPREFDQQYKINVFGAYNLTRHLLPVMKENHRGLIVNICSQASLTGKGDSGAYAMSKHAVLGYTRSLRKELMDSTIGVTAINLGQTYSTSWKDVDINPNKLIDPEDVGRLIVSLSGLSARSVVEEVIMKPQGGEVSPM